MAALGGALMVEDEVVLLVRVAPFRGRFSLFVISELFLSGVMLSTSYEVRLLRMFG